MDERFEKAMEDFITGRINDWGYVSSKAVSEAMEQAEGHEGKLKDSFSEEQQKLWNAYESARSVLSGEETHFYYRAGFGDALRFLCRMREK